jgi:nitrate reductase alpha subunit
MLALIAAANIYYTIKKHGPDRIAGFSPIPAMSPHTEHRKIDVPGLQDR